MSMGSGLLHLPNLPYVSLYVVKRMKSYSILSQRQNWICVFHFLRHPLIHRNLLHALKDGRRKSPFFRPQQEIFSPRSTVYPGPKVNMPAKPVLLTISPRSRCPDRDRCEDKHRGWLAENAGCRPFIGHFLYYIDL